MKNKTFYARSEIYLIGSNVTIFENRKEVLNHSTLVGSGGEEESMQWKEVLFEVGNVNFTPREGGREKKGRDEAARKRWKEVDKEVDNEGWEEERVGSKAQRRL